jgi:lysozyme-like protein/LysM domain-containing protein
MAGTMKLTDQQIAAYVAQGGFAGANRVTAIAIVLAESGGDTKARGDTSLQTNVWGPSIGLFQIRSLKSQRGTGGERDELANLDPATNARHAHRIFLEAGSRFSPWSTFGSGAYRRFLDRARRASGQNGQGGGNGQGGRNGHPGQTYVIRSGDTLSGIASSHGITLGKLRALNPGLFDAAHRNGNMIRPGEVVRL